MKQPWVLVRLVESRSCAFSRNFEHMTDVFLDIREILLRPDKKGFFVVAEMKIKKTECLHCDTKRINDVQSKRFYDKANISR